MNHIIDIEIKQKRYNALDSPILENFHLKLQPGEDLAIMGESGAGKTTLLNIIALIDHDFEGQYFLKGRNTANLSLKEQAQIRNSQIGFILQENSLIDSLSLEDNIKLPLIYAKDKNDKKEAKVFFHSLVDELNIQSILSKKPLECSGGQRARAAIARALVMQPQLILADEPTASLDSKNSLHVINILKELNQKKNSTIITITHDPLVANHHHQIIELR